MENVTADKLRRIHGEKADEVFAEIAMLGGFGKVGTEQGGLDPNANLDIAGALDPANKAVSEGNKNKIRELIGEAKAEKKNDASK